MALREVTKCRLIKLHSFFFFVVRHIYTFSFMYLQLWHLWFNENEFLYFYRKIVLNGWNFTEESNGFSPMCNSFSFLERKEIMRKFEGLSCVLQEGYRLCRYHRILYTDRRLQKTSVLVLNGNKLRYYSEPLYLPQKKIF